MFPIWPLPMTSFQLELKRRLCRRFHLQQNQITTSVRRFIDTLICGKNSQLANISSRNSSETFDIRSNIPYVICQTWIRFNIYLVRYLNCSTLLGKHETFSCLLAVQGKRMQFFLNRSPWQRVFFCWPGSKFPYQMPKMSLPFWFVGQLDWSWRASHVILGRPCSLKQAEHRGEKDRAGIDLLAPAKAPSATRSADFPIAAQKAKKEPTWRHPHQ